MKVDTRRRREAGCQNYMGLIMLLTKKYHGQSVPDAKDRATVSEAGSSAGRATSKNTTKTGGANFAFLQLV
jgi:hypothetical protein